MAKSKFLFPLLLLAGCSYEDPQATQQKEAAPANPAAEVSSAAGTTPKLVQFVAAPYEIPAATAYTMRCDLNSVSGTGLNPGVASDVSKAGKAFLAGWLATDALGVPGEFIVVLKGASSYGISGVAGLERPDVAEALGSQSVFLSGYGFEADISSIPVGQYSVHIMAPAEGVGCDTTKLLNVVE